LSASYIIKLWIAALLAADIGWALKLTLPNLHPIPLAAIVLGVYGVSYFGVTFTLDISESRTMLGKVLHLLKLGR
jgi:putative peptidoglycan lipid II flippase